MKPLKKLLLGTANFGNKNYWGRGICTESVNLITKYAFEELGLIKITLGVIAENIGALKCYKKAGFEIDNIERHSLKTVIKTIKYKQ